MRLDRRQLLAIGAALLGASRLGVGRTRARERATLDQLLEAHAALLPERAGAGANHYPMAAEALEALGHETAIEEAWVRGAGGYAGTLPRRAPIVEPEAALGNYERFGDWLDHFRAALAREPWRVVVGEWAPRLAPGLSAATFHGLIRTGHAARALRRRESDARKHELAVGLAYWAARYTELPCAASSTDSPRASLAALEHSAPSDATDVPFDAVMERLTRTPIALPLSLAPPDTSPTDALDELLLEATTALLEMLVQERHRIWLLHGVTGPAAVGLLLPELDDAGARQLVDYARQAVFALYQAFGAPFAARAHVRAAPLEWPELIQRATDSGSVHTIKLIEALSRFRHVDDPLCRSVGTQWLEWT